MNAVPQCESLLFQGCGLKCSPIVVFKLAFGSMIDQRLIVALVAGFTSRILDHLPDCPKCVSIAVSLI